MSFQVEIDKAIKEKNLYFIGDALPPDWYAAFKLWLPLAHAGDPKAQFNVGRCYDRGDGVDENKIQAKEWYLKAAEQNDPRAFFNLYLFFQNENTAQRDFEKAKNFFNCAIELGEVRAIKVASNQKVYDERQKFMNINKEADEKLSILLKNKENRKAIEFIKEINDSRLMWLKEYLPLLECEIFKKNDRWIIKNISTSMCYFENLYIQPLEEKEIEYQIDVSKEDASLRVEYKDPDLEFCKNKNTNEWERWRKLKQGEIDYRFESHFGLETIATWNYEENEFSYEKKKIKIFLKEAKEAYEAQETKRIKEAEEASPFRKIKRNPEKNRTKKLTKQPKWLLNIINIIEKFSEFKQAKNNRDKTL